MASKPLTPGQTLALWFAYRTLRHRARLRVSRLTPEAKTAHHTSLGVRVCGGPHGVTTPQEVPRHLAADFAESLARRPPAISAVAWGAALERWTGCGLAGPPLVPVTRLG